MSTCSWSAPGEPLPVCDLVILPGTKATIADLAFLRAQGWDIDLLAHARRGGKILGICGGYQMLGKTISDPLGMEGPPGEVAGLGLLDVTTELTGDKILRACAGVSVAEGAAFAGYEMHVGDDAGRGLRAAAAALRRRPRRRRHLGRTARSAPATSTACSATRRSARRSLRWIGAEDLPTSAYEADSRARARRPRRPSASGISISTRCSP